MSDSKALAAEVRERLGSAPALDDPPLVSIIVLNRNGEEQLRRLLAGLVEHTDYPSLELTVIDNGSSDGSVDWLREVEAPFPISILANPNDESLSDANNQGAEVASGELLLFLNSDTEPFEDGWLCELVACMACSGAGAVGATLICPDAEWAKAFRHGYHVQHRGLRFAEGDNRRLSPELRGWGDDPLDEELGTDVSCDAVAAECLLVSRENFHDAGGFFPGYSYGCEDVDLSLKLRAAGCEVVCSGRSIAIHYPGSSRREVPFQKAYQTKPANLRLLWRRWGPMLQAGGPQPPQHRDTPIPLLQRPEARLSVTVDHLIASLVLRRPDVFFVQIGAYDGTTADQLHPYATRHNWRGIAIEPQPHAFAKLREAYSAHPGVDLRNVAVAEKRGTRALYTVDPDLPNLPAWTGGLASFDRWHVERAVVPELVAESAIRELQVECVSVAELLAGVERVDLLMIDVEGYDAEIIQAFPFDVHLPSIVQFESLTLSPKAHDDAVRRLTEHGYLVALTPVDTIAWHKGDA